MSECSVKNNDTSNDSVAIGGGICIENIGIIEDCSVISNTSYNIGGGIVCYSGGTVSRTVISRNSADSCAGGIYCYGGGALTNCLIGEQNQAPEFAGVYLCDGGALYNCTIAGNYASRYCGGICTSNRGTVVNTIIYDNTAVLGYDNWQNYGNIANYSHCCTTPTNNLPNENQCLPEDPPFAGALTNFHLTETSPCRNAGVVMPWMTDATDLDGNPRTIAGKVDIGCYEYIPEPGAFGVIFSYLLLACVRKLIR